MVQVMVMVRVVFVARVVVAARSPAMARSRPILDHDDGHNMHMSGSR